jgi:hypothetical protein
MKKYLRLLQKDHDIEEVKFTHDKDEKIWHSLSDVRIILKYIVDDAWNIHITGVDNANNHINFIEKLVSIPCQFWKNSIWARGYHRFEKSTESERILVIAKLSENAIKKLEKCLQNGKSLIVSDENIKPCTPKLVPIRRISRK